MTDKFGGPIGELITNTAETTKNEIKAYGRAFWAQIAGEKPHNNNTNQPASHLRRHQEIMASTAVRKQTGEELITQLPQGTKLSELQQKVTQKKPKDITRITKERGKKTL